MSGKLRKSLPQKDVGIFGVCSPPLTPASQTSDSSVWYKKAILSGFGGFSSGQHGNVLLKPSQICPADGSPIPSQYATALHRVCLDAESFLSWPPRPAQSLLLPEMSSKTSECDPIPSPSCKSTPKHGPGSTWPQVEHYTHGHGSLILF